MGQNLNVTINVTCIILISETNIIWNFLTSALNTFSDHLLAAIIGWRVKENNSFSRLLEINYKETNLDHWKFIILVQRLLKYENLNIILPYREEF
jgi:hypothetical protein